MKSEKLSLAKSPQQETKAAVQETAQRSERSSSAAADDKAREDAQYQANERYGSTWAWGHAEDHYESDSWSEIGEEE